MSFIIHVNQYVIKFNKKYGADLPPYRVQNGRSDQRARYCRKVIWNGPSETVYSPNDPLRCGAQIWIETNTEPTLVDECFFSDIKKEMDKFKEEQSA